MKKLFTLIALVFTSQLFGLNVYIMLLHNPGCDNQSGKIYVGVTNVNGSYTLQWSNGATTDTIGGLSAGVYSVTAYDGSGSASDTVELDSFGVGEVQVGHICDANGGYITLNNITASWPSVYSWYRNGQLLSNSSSYIENLDTALYFWRLVDAQGCVDSGYATIKQSWEPAIQVFLSDSSLCWQQQSQVWFSPGFNLYDSWDNEFHSTTDTFVFTNNLASTQPIPVYMKDSLGCTYNLASFGQFPFVYLQGHPDPIPLYQKGDTVSASFFPQLTPDPNHTYRWMLDGVLLEESNYSFVVLDTSGHVSLFKENEYGCGWGGWLQATLSISEQGKHFVSIFPNPLSAADYLNIHSEQIIESFELYDLHSRVVYKANDIDSYSFRCKMPGVKGIYFVKVNSVVNMIVLE